MVRFYLTISGKSCSHQAAPNKPLIFPVTICVMADLARTHETEIEFLVHYNLNRKPRKTHTYHSHMVANDTPCLQNLNCIPVPSVKKPWTLPGS